MSHWWCCCAACPYGGPPDCLDKTKGTVTWFTHTVNDDGTITRLDENNEDDDIAAAHRGPCYTVYVDSLSGDQDETGDGTEGNPWRNLNSVFNKNVAKSGAGDSLSSGVLTPGGSPDGWATDRFVDRTITLDATDATVSGSSASLSSGVLTPSPAPTGWIADRLIGETVTIDGTAYTITANTTSTLTLADPPDDGTYDWTLNVSTEFSCTVTANTTTTLTVDAPLFDSSSCNWTLHVFDDDCIYNICTHADPPDNCPKVKVLVKGTIDYVIVGDSGRNYQRNLVIEPWNDGTITIDVGGNRAVENCVGVVWKHANATATGTGTSGYSHAYGFQSCHASTFDNCSGSGTSAGGIGYGFYYCYSSVLDTCNGSGSGVVTGGYGGWFGSGHGFRHCYSSTLKNCTGVGTVTGVDVDYSYGKGYTYCYSSVFDTCVGSGTGKGNTVYGANAGYYHCHYSIFRDCTGTGTTVADGNGKAVGFFYNIYSVFDTCDGTGNARETGCRIACGFNRNDCSSFYTCTTSDRVCEDCPGIPYFSCDDWVCDDLDTQLLDYEETIEGTLKLEPEHTVLDIRETIEGVLKLEPEHSILDIRETIEGVLKLEVTHSIV